MSMAILYRVPSTNSHFWAADPSQLCQPGSYDLLRSILQYMIEKPWQALIKIWRWWAPTTDLPEQCFVPLNQIAKDSAVAFSYQCCHRPGCRILEQSCRQCTSPGIHSGWCSSRGPIFLWNYHISSPGLRLHLSHQTSRFEERHFARHILCWED